MRLLRLFLIATVMTVPGCLVFTCGTTRSVERQSSVDRSIPASPESPGPGAGSRW